ncbi:MAG TPA: endonuclease/exonuclease/phosphatase family protein [Micromonosporaceae bacterium]|jgi:endonuclease/exonuclease/phosphatase family metal-dependent hydrolase
MARADEPGRRDVRIRIVSYNVHGLRDDQAALASVVRAIAPDIAVVQEAPRRFRWRLKCAVLANSWDMRYAAGGLPSVGNLIVTSDRVRVHDTWCVRYLLTPGRHLRGAVFARCSIGDVTFVVAGTHLATDDAERGGQARAFRQAMSAITEPIMVAVDVNETSDGTSWTVLSDGLIDAGLVGEPSAEPATFPSSAPTRRIDAIFVDPRYTIEAYEVVATPAARAASDHLPLRVDLRIPA